MPGLVGPERFPIRQPDSEDRVVGRMVNPVRYPEIGGFAGPSRWYGGDDSKKNSFAVEKPTSVRAARKTTGTNED